VIALDVWRLVVAEHAAEIAEALVEELGPIRARTVSVSAGEHGVVVDLDTGERDVERSVWALVVQLARIWPEIAQGAEIALEVRVGGLNWVTSAEGMAAVVGGCHRPDWLVLSTQLCAAELIRRRTTARP